jgi:molybdopterin synthase sulfur carrier subunit
MSVKVMVPGSLKSWFDGADEVLCEGSTVGQCLDQLGRRFPGLKDRLLTPDKEIGAVIVFLNGDNIRKRNGLGTPVSDGDEIGIVPLAAGG